MNSIEHISMSTHGLIQILVTTLFYSYILLIVQKTLCIDLRATIVLTLSAISLLKVHNKSKPHRFKRWPNYLFKMSIDSSFVQFSVCMSSPTVSEWSPQRVVLNDFHQCYCRKTVLITFLRVSIYKLCPNTV